MSWVPVFIVLSVLVFGWKLTLCLVGLVALCLLIGSNPMACLGGAVVLITVAVSLDAIASYNGGWFDLNQTTPQAIANPPRAEVQSAQPDRPAPVTKAGPAKTRQIKPARRPAQPVTERPDSEAERRLTSLRALSAK